MSKTKIFGTILCGLGGFLIQEYTENIIDSILIITAFYSMAWGVELMGHE